MVRYHYPTGGSVFDSVTTEEAQITNATLVKALPASDITGIASMTFTSPDWDVPIKDERGEFDSTTNSFTPDETGWYWISSEARDGQSSDQDRHEARVYNVTDGIEVYKSPPMRGSGSGVDAHKDIVVLEELTADKGYQIQFRNGDSTFDIDKFGGQLSIRRAFR